MVGPWAQNVDGKHLLQFSYQWKVRVLPHISMMIPTFCQECVAVGCFRGVVTLHRWCTMKTAPLPSNNCYKWGVARQTGCITGTTDIVLPWNSWCQAGRTCWRLHTRLRKVWLQLIYNCSSKICHHTSVPAQTLPLCLGSLGWNRTAPCSDAVQT